MIHRYIIEATDEVKGFDEAIEKLEREWGIEELEPCEDCVSREAVIDLVADYDLNMDQVVKGIHALPPVTPKQKVGKWIVHPKGGYAHLVCSKCLSDAPFGCKTNYCPDCGACMEESEE